MVRGPTRKNPKLRLFKRSSWPLIPPLNIPQLQPELYLSTIGFHGQDKDYGPVTKRALKNYRAKKRKLVLEVEKVEEQVVAAMKRTDEVRGRWQKAKLEQERRYQALEQLRTDCTDLDLRLEDLKDQIQDMTEEAEDMEGDLERWNDD
ncbi:hypothetical protein Hypma_007799 [Hypsizygus marmoreus]|uniref:Uncharacterized protein n=1 Tax=Hypsizygus marmoreus TaxID=39966 RepID=A0A369JRE2_HYPMA|nr:hypothetical protein Hypma_007799 [Hypsizygus marmoreus]